MPLAVGQEKMESLGWEAVAPLISRHVDEVRNAFGEVEGVPAFLDQIGERLRGELGRFQAAPKEGTGKPEPDPLREFSVNLLVDNSETEGRPVIVETSDFMTVSSLAAAFDMSFGMVKALILSGPLVMSLVCCDSSSSRQSVAQTTRPRAASSMVTSLTLRPSSRGASKS